MIGYEFEFLSGLSPQLTKNMVGRGISVVEDPTIRRDKNTRGFNKHEIVTLPESKNKSRKTALRVIDHIKEYGVTNKSCGLHINISIDGILHIDPAALISLDYEDALLKYWGRDANYFTCSWATVLRRFRTYIRRYHKEYDTPRKFEEACCDLIWYCSDLIDDPSELVENFYQLMNVKYCATNVSKLSLGYIEFRMPGGHVYQFRENDILDTTDQLLYHMNTATKDSPRSEYFNFIYES